MEAPEKIYLFENPIDGTPDYRWLSKRSCNDDVEYVRLDTLIEKACDYINKELPITDLSDSNVFITFKVFDKECKKAFIEDFKKYMKGE